jgi:hypothetical protein
LSRVLTTEEKIRERLREIRDFAQPYAEAKAQAGFLEDFKKSKLAILMKKYEAAGYTTAAAQEREARADPEYVEVLEGLRAAVEKAEHLRWQLITAQLGAEVWRSLEASRRAELHSTGFTGD